MKCPNCGVTNGKTNKYCRECGHKLDDLTLQVEPSAPVEELIPSVIDDVALGEELFGVMRLYEDGDLDKAAEYISRIIKSSPESASAHSISALIFERKADIQAGLGDTKSVRDLYNLAVAEYETIIDLNPDSVADREKLIALRMKLAGHALPQPSISVKKAAAVVPNKAKDIIKKLPPPVLASAGAFVIILILGIALLPHGKSSNRDASRITPGDVGVIPVSSPSQVAATPAPASPQLSVYTYPSQPMRPASPAPTTDVTTPVAPKPERPKIPSVEPIKLPPIGDSLTIVPEPKKPDSEAKPTPPKPKSGTGSPKKTTPDPTPSDDASSSPDGSSVLASAITLGNQGKYAEAIQAAQQAASLFQSDISAGRNTTSAQRGLNNARKYIQLWQSMEAR